jgi:hypothetical protein
VGALVEALEVEETVAEEALVLKFVELQIHSTRSPDQSSAV